MPASLMGCYKVIMDAFNGANGNPPDYNKLISKMDQTNIVLKKVMHPESLQGAYATNYLLTDMSKRNCSFKRVTATAYPTNETGAVYGNVSGQGYYYDDDYKDPKGNQIPIQVTFSWCFSRPTDQDEWLLVNVFGAEIG